MARINLKRIVLLLLKTVLPLKAYVRFERFALSLLLRKTTLISGLLFKYPIRLFGNYPNFLYPETLSIFLTTRCNIRCFICRRENHKGEDLNFENIYKLEKSIKNASIIDLTGWGEPLLYPKFKEVLAYIYSVNPRRELIQITTNGTLLSKDVALLLSGHLKRITISLNAATRETYNRDMKFGEFQKTTLNIKKFMKSLENEDKNKVYLHFVAHTNSYNEIPDFVRLAYDLKVPNVSIGNYLVGQVEHAKFSLLNIKNEYNSVVSTAEKISRELKINLSARRFYIEEPISSQLCTDPYKSCFILPNGEVNGPCCFAGNYSMGNIYETSFEAVWFGEKYLKIRRVRHLQACQRCTPYVIFDDPNAHFTEIVKQTEEFKSMVNTLHNKCLA